MKQQAQAGVQRGRLVYVIGPSGAGKDSIISYARDKLGTDGGPHVFPRRYITRPPDDRSEDHVAIASETFDLQCQAGRFALFWGGNGLRYGIGNEIDLWLQTGRHVIVNGSRAYLPDAARRYPDLVPVLIVIDPAVLRQRLMSRGREDFQQIEERLKRAADLPPVEHPALRAIANNRAPEEAGEAFVALLSTLST